MAVGTTGVWMAIDTGCGKACAGTEWCTRTDAYIAAQYGLRSVRKPEREGFQFGAGGPVASVCWRELPA
eukprot:3661019-Lingulodinium_polyedra.AAC.1